MRDEASRPRDEAQAGRELERARSIALGAGGSGVVALLGAVIWFRQGKV